MENNDEKVTNINLSASARLIFQLGEQMISDEFVALMELIKNAYDADATKVEVIVDTKIETSYGIGKITIIDNGNGMLPSIIKKEFLRLSSSFKKDNKLSPYYKRRVLGEKGLGRLSIQRLGKYIDITTTPRMNRLASFCNNDDKKILENNNHSLIKLDWGLLELDIDLQEVTANVKNEYSENPRYGTKLEILGIRNINFWDFGKKDEKKLKTEIFNMVNPFTKDHKSRFEILIYIDGKLFTNKNIDENIIEKMSDIKIDFSMENQFFMVSITRKERYANRLKLNLIKKMNENRFDLEFENKDAIKEICKKKTYEFDLSDMAKGKEDIPFLKEVVFEMIESLENEDKAPLIAYPGDLKGVLYAADFSAETQKEFLKLIAEKQFPEDIKIYNELKNVWDAAQGVYLFRNEFRILPYGKQDWIGFTNKSQTYKNNIYKEHSVAGYITIDGETSENLVEQTNRQGIIEDEYGKNFLKIFKEVLLEMIVREDVDFRSGFTIGKIDDKSEIINSRNKLLTFKRIIIDEDEKEELMNEVAETINNVSKEKENTSLEEKLNLILKKHFVSEEIVKTIIESSDERICGIVKIMMMELEKESQIKKNIASLEETINKIKKVDTKIEAKNKQDIYIKEREIAELHGIFPLVGQSIIVESLTHELNRIDENIKTYALNTKSDLIQNGLFINLDQLIKNQQMIIDETIYLREQLDHLEPTYRKNEKILEVVDLKKFIEETYCQKGPMNKKASNLQIDVQIFGDTFFLKANKGYLITVFDNLFLNSLYWLNEGKNNKNICFEIKENGSVLFWDSGPGIHKDIENELFDPFKSMKKDGRGLGLFIARELLNAMDADICMNQERRNDRLYKFEVKFNSIQGV